MSASGMSSGSGSDSGSATPSGSRVVRARSDTAGSTTPIMEKAHAHAHAHTASQPFRVPPTSTGASASGGLALPFRFSVARAQAMTVRNVPYLRHGWSRLDCVALVGFWVAFALAQAGAERGPGGAHVGLFRALSVLRLARLLAITSGTTVRRAVLFVGEEEGAD